MYWVTYFAVLYIRKLWVFDVNDGQSLRFLG